MRVRDDAGVQQIGVRRVDFGYFVRPAEETGTGSPRVEPCLGYLIEHRDGVLLFDTGMGAHPAVEARYRPRRVALPEALAAAGSGLNQVTEIANCHLHFDHCGGNPLLGNRPVFVQRVELAEATIAQDYTLPELLDGNRFEQLTGETEVLSGVWLIPTPGHTNGHQSMIVRRTDGTVILAGQSHDTATQYASDHLAWRAGQDHGQQLPKVPVWMDRLQALDPRAVYFAHDHSVWMP